MNVQMSPLPGVQVVDWTFDLTPMVPPTPTMRWNDRDVYWILYLHGVNSFYFVDYDFDFTLEVPANHSAPFLFDIGLGAHFHDAEHTKTREFVDFTSSFPAWTNVQNWTAYQVSYQF